MKSRTDFGVNIFDDLFDQKDILIQWHGFIYFYFSEMYFLLIII
ncbi:hypothetical protein XBP1_550001 [Xenorhabdus bovienii str. puntauvense]|uniref:Uncharacterized protein n=1 Tax=Xenorhabdus bovienii str. puntauvense TaxID=1398201 RepID=A0A077NM41_XENBV|nr:hypothetical protein XBP1_550001 [Xenorhabdus bovienii str. puntauvense]